MKRLKDIDKKFAFNEPMSVGDLQKKIEKMDFFAADGKNVCIHVNDEVILLCKVDSNLYEVYSIRNDQLFDCGRVKKASLKVIGDILRDYTDKRINVSVANCYI